MLESGAESTADQYGLINPYSFVVKKKCPDGTLELVKELQDFVKTTTSPHKYPRWVEFVETLPKTATGKIQRYKLRELAAERPLESR